MEKIIRSKVGWAMLLALGLTTQMAPAGILSGNGGSTGSSEPPVSVSAGLTALNMTPASRLGESDHLSFAVAEAVHPNNAAPIGAVVELRSDVHNGTIGFGTFAGNANIISPVPEPITYALLLFGSICLGGVAGRLCLGRRRQA